MFTSNRLNHGQAKQKRVLVIFIRSNSIVNRVVDIFSVNHGAIGDCRFYKKLVVK